MNARLLLFAMLSGSQCSPAEIEAEIHVGFSSEIRVNPRDETVDSQVIPILISVKDEQGKPVSGAYAAMKRLAPDDYQESDIVSPESSRTDVHGHAVVLYSKQVGFDCVGTGGGISTKITTTHADGTKTVEEKTEPPLMVQAMPIVGEKQTLRLPGVITVVAEGLRTTALELEKACGEKGIEIGEHTTLHFTIVMTRKDGGKTVEKAPEASEKK